MDIFDKMFNTFKKSAKRIETLPIYKIEGSEWEEYKLYSQGKTIKGFANQSWIDDLTKWSKQNKKISRIRIIPPILNPYLIYEIEWCYHKNVLNGEIINFVKKEDYDKLSKNIDKTDIWIFDDKFVLQLIYHKDGSYKTEKFIDNSEEVKKYVLLYKELEKKSQPYPSILNQIRTSPLSIKL